MCIVLFDKQGLRKITNRDEPILPAKFLEKQDYESKEQNSGKIGGVSRYYTLTSNNTVVSAHETHRET